MVETRDHDARILCCNKYAAYTFISANLKTEKIKTRRTRLPRRHPLERSAAFGDLVESLLVDGENRHLRYAKKASIVERSDLQNNCREHPAAA